MARPGLMCPRLLNVAVKSISFGQSVGKEEVMTLRPFSVGKPWVMWLLLGN